MMKYNSFAAFAILMMTYAISAYADDVITIRLSYKVVLNPADGTRPPGVRDADIDRAIAEMNALEQTYYRGYRFQRVDPVIDIGGRGDLTGPSRWYNTDFFDRDNGVRWKNEMEDEAMRNQVIYVWNAIAINIYITNGICGGICSFPEDADNIIIVGGCADGDGRTQLHEIGHYFSLFHTQGRRCGCCDLTRIGECNTEPGDDEIVDTLPDLACWNRDDIANWTYRTSYAALNSFQQELVNDVFLNVMSYHESACGQNVVTTRMTEGQLDRWTDAAKFFRSDVVDGQTWFVDPSLGGGFGGGGYSVVPFRSIALAVFVADSVGGDIILLRPGALNETITITKPITLRATRAGTAVIGATNLVAQSAPSQTPKETITKADEDVFVISASQKSIMLGFPGSRMTKKD